MRSRLLILTATLAMLLLGAGCSELVSPVGPKGPGRSQSAPAVLNLDVSAEVWNVVATRLVLPGLVSEVRGSRYTLTFQPLSLVDALLVTIKERDAGIVDVDLGPDGSVFARSVTLEIDYRGTVYDPTQPDYRGRRPKVFWFNPDTNEWVKVPGNDDAKNCVYSVKLQHFSRYAMGDGTSGWEDVQGDRDKEFVK